MSEQLRRLSRGVDIVVGTPGRVLDHIRRGTLKLDKVRFLVLDEADEMLNMGFVEDVEEIMGHTGEDRRVSLFSATMPERIIRLSEAYMRNTEVLRVESQTPDGRPHEPDLFRGARSRQVRRHDAHHRHRTGLFTASSSAARRSAWTRWRRVWWPRAIRPRGCTATCRRPSARRFSASSATRRSTSWWRPTWLRRGIDVSNLSHVINYSLPQDSESYVHRIGRTGRAGNQGTAITFISGAELRRFNWMMRDIKADIKRETCLRRRTSWR